MGVVHAGVDHSHDDVAAAAGRQAVVAQPLPGLGHVGRGQVPLLGVQRIVEVWRLRWLRKSTVLRAPLRSRSASSLAHRLAQIVRLGPGHARRLGQASTAA